MSQSTIFEPHQVTTLPPIGLQEAIIKIEQQGYKVKYPEKLLFESKGLTYKISSGFQFAYTYQGEFNCTFAASTNEVLGCKNDYSNVTATYFLSCVILVILVMVVVSFGREIK